MITDTKADLDLTQALAGFHGVILRSFLDSDMRLAWASQGVPRVSIILVLLNRAEMTLHCLRSLQGLSIPVEIIAVDNASMDETSLLLDRLDGIKILRRRENTGFAPAVNAAARVAAGDHILILDNDAEVLPGSLESAVETLESADDIGAVVGKVVFPEGRLEEAGGIILRDGSCRGYGRRDSPWAPTYMYRRDVDYGSSTFLLTRRKLFIGLQGFDEDYGPAYYEDVDYCVRLWKSCKRVVFDPGAVVVHFDFKGSPAGSGANLLASKHADWVFNKQSWSDLRVIEARAVPKPGQRILVLDDRVPHFRHGAGFPRTCELVRTLDESGHFVTFYPVTMPAEDWSEVYDDIPQTVEVMVGWGEARLSEFIEEREGYYDHIIVSRPHNMKTFRSKFWRDGGWATKARVIYDAEAIFTLREAEQRRMAGEEVTESAVARLLAEEMKLADGVHSVFSVTDRERDCFLSSGVGTVWTLGHIVTVRPTPRTFGERDRISVRGRSVGGTESRCGSLVWPRDLARTSLSDWWRGFLLRGGLRAHRRDPRASRYPCARTGDRSHTALRSLANLRCAQPACRWYPDQGTDRRGPWPSGRVHLDPGRGAWLAERSGTACR